MNRIAESDLVHRLQRGEEAAQRAFFNQYRGMLIRRIRGKTRRFSREDVEEIVQETFIRAFKSIASFRGDCTLKTWLVKLGDNAAIDHHRKLQRQRRNAREAKADSGTEAAPLGWMAGASRPDCPLQEAKSAETRNQLGLLVAKLTKEQRDVINDRIMTGLSTRETAERMQKSEGAVKQQLKRALEALAGHMRQSVQGKPGSNEPDGGHGGK